MDIAQKTAAVIEIRDMLEGMSSAEAIGVISLAYVTTLVDNLDARGERHKIPAGKLEAIRILSRVFDEAQQNLHYPGRNN